MANEKKLKIGLLTLVGYYNYGNRLQNYALQVVIENLGMECETILNSRASHSKKKIVERIKRITFKKLINKLYYKREKQLLDARKNKFKEFSRLYINESSFVISKDNMPNDLSDKYNFFVCGSDQIWNPNNLHGTSFYFLTFAEKEKRISYAASFGISYIPEDYRAQYKNWLQNMKSISVRENTGKEIVKELCNREAEVHVDPTLLLSREDWLSVATTAVCKPDVPYLLTYFLGNKTKTIKKAVDKMGRENNLAIINLVDTQDPKAFLTDPSEFIDLINSASLICTDSFHGVVFSILMETPFIVFERHDIGESMYSRIESLLKMLKLEHRQYSELQDGDDILYIDFTHVVPILEKEKRRSIEYLRKKLMIVTQIN